MMAAALARRVLISASSDTLLVIVEPRYVKLSTNSDVTLSMLIDGDITTPCPMTFAFLDTDGQSKFFVGVGESIH